MDSSSKTKSLFLRHSRSDQMSFKKGFQKHTIISQKRPDVPVNIYSNHKKTIKKLPKLHTPTTKQSNSQPLSHSCNKMSSNHKKRLNFEHEDPTPKKSTNSPNDMFIKGLQTAVIQKKDNNRMETEDRAKTISDFETNNLIVRKLEFVIPEDNSMEDEGVFCLKISREVEGPHIKKIKTEIKIEHDKLENQFFYNRNQDDLENTNLSKVTLNTFNSFRLSSENKLIDMMDSKAQIEFQKQACEEIQRKFASKEFSNFLKNDDKKSEDEKKICCNCKKSRCLKLYCECFAAQKFCQDCNCVNCANLKTNEAEKERVVTSLLNRNPHAFKPKLEYEESQIIATQVAVKHTKGCNCKKTLCSKKYCECFQAGIKCSELCKCEDCRNCDLSDYQINQLNQAKNLFYCQISDRNVVKLEKNKNLFTGFAKHNHSQNSNKIKMNLFNSMINEKVAKEENRFLREKISPYPQLKFEEAN